LPSSVTRRIARMRSSFEASASASPMRPALSARSRNMSNASWRKSATERPSMGTDSHDIPVFSKMNLVSSLPFSCCLVAPLR